MLDTDTPREWLDSDLLTTGQVARIFGMAPRTATKWFDKGILKGFRITGSLDRRTTVAEVRRILHDCGLSDDRLELGRKQPVSQEAVKSHRKVAARKRTARIKKLK